MAMELIQKLEQSDVEIAITHANIGNLCFAHMTSAYAAGSRNL